MREPESSCSDKRELGDHPGHVLEVPVVVKQDKVVLDCDAGDEAVDSGADRHPGPATPEVDERGLPVALDGVPWVVEGLGAQVLRYLVELPPRGDALNDFLVDRTSQTYRVTAIEHPSESPVYLGLLSSQIIYPD